MLRKTPSITVEGPFIYFKKWAISDAYTQKTNNKCNTVLNYVMALLSVYYVYFQGVKTKFFLSLNL